MISTREELIFLLSEASELEHMISCQYLFAAFSLKKDESDGLTAEQMRCVTDWGQTLYVLSREEMSHLGTVSNLLTAIGAMPHFVRPNFPQRTRYFPFPMELHRFTKETLKQFVCTERPEKIEPADAFCKQMAELRQSKQAPDQITPVPIAYQTVGELYRNIREAFESIDERTLFLGPSNAQAGSAELQLVYPDYNVARPGVFDVTPVPIRDRASAVKAIDAIVAQGEGATTIEPSHYRRLLGILAELEKLEAQDPKFDPSRNVVSNPSSFKQPDAPDCTVIENSDARELLDLFNGVYELLLQLLIRFYAHTDETASDVQGLRYTLFPMMTMAIRPLGEMLTELPAFDDPKGPRAGAGFSIYRTANLLPHKDSAWKVLCERFQAAASRCTELGKKPSMPKRLAYVGESLQYTANRFLVYMNA